MKAGIKRFLEREKDAFTADFQWMSGAQYGKLTQASPKG